MRMEIRKLTALELGEKIRKKEISIREVLDDTWKRIEAREEELHCFLTLNRDGAYARAEQLQREIGEGRIRSPFLGVPYAVKDNLCTKGLRTTCGSAMLESFVPSYSASAVTALEKAGAILLGKTNLDEFAMGSSTETSYFGGTANPWNRAHVPGGSSGGSAAALAAEECFFALGSDTGGSVRQPASHCGVVGMKPTYGTISRYGLIAYSSSMDQIGTLTKDGKDCRELLQLLSGRDEKDSTCLGRGRVEDREFKGLRIGIIADFMGDEVSPEVRRAVTEAAKALERKGAVIKEVTLGVAELVAPAYYTIACAEASSNLERYDGVKYGLRIPAKELHDMYGRTRTAGFGREVKRRILLGTFVLSEGYYDAYYLKALKVRRMIRNACDRAFSECDVLLCPVASTAAPRKGEFIGNPIRTYQQDVHTALANLAGLPALSTPWGQDGNGMPIGVQILGNLFREDLVLCVQREVERGRL